MQCHGGGGGGVSVNCAAAMMEPTNGVLSTVISTCSAAVESGWPTGSTSGSSPTLAKVMQVDTTGTQIHTNNVTNITIQECSLKSNLLKYVSNTRTKYKCKRLAFELSSFAQGLSFSHNVVHSEVTMAPVIVLRRQSDTGRGRDQG
eukprot:2050709-Amphidinium_carterae.1